MDVTNIALGISNIFVGLLIIIISLPLARRKVPMNRVYGVRLKKSFESEENWYTINAYGGRLLIGWSIRLVLIGVATFFLPLEGKPRHLGTRLQKSPRPFASKKDTPLQTWVQGGRGKNGDDRVSSS